VRDAESAPGVGQAEIGRIFREESGRAVAALIRLFGDIDTAEDAAAAPPAAPVRRPRL
jgi:RNA polymerase sigma-70 factor, ECF subfamily